ncbi:MAG: uncharacterized protein JWN10_565 [Solirubrobacterales bacterium]|nr:uncharacterized protein [Solirubrobacterales bacterium]
MRERVSATPEVFELLEPLAARYGPLVVNQSVGGCCDGSSPICLPAGELPPGPGDVLLGTIARLPYTSMVSRISAGSSRSFGSACLLARR